MITTVDNNQRVFLLQKIGWGTNDIFCNLHDIPVILKTHFERYDEIKISEYWNRQFRRASKKLLNEMFVANKIDFEIK